jgi:hypothetical protein
MSLVPLIIGGETLACASCGREFSIGAILFFKVVAMHHMSVQDQVEAKSKPK